MTASGVPKGGAEKVELKSPPNQILSGQSEKPVAILAPVFSTMHTIWTV